LCADGWALADGADKLCITISENQMALLKGIADFFFLRPKDVKGPEKAPDQKPGQGEESRERVLRETIPANPEKILKVGLIGDNLPLTDMRNGHPLGFEVDLVKLTLKGKAVTPMFIVINVDDVEKAIRDGTVDVALGGFVKGGESDGTLECSESYLNTDVVAIFWRRPKKISQKFSFLGKTIGVVGGSFCERYIREARIEGANITAFSTQGEMLTDLLENDKNPGHHIDILLTNSHAACDIVARYPELESLPLGAKREVAMVAAKGSPWLEMFNRGIADGVVREIPKLMGRWNLKKI
jgi:hypothetical protein